MPLTLKESIMRSTDLPRDEQVLMGRATLLARRDRELLEAVLIKGQSAPTLAGMMGITPRAVRRRVNRLAERLTSRAFLDAVRALPDLPPEDAELVRLRYGYGLSYRQLMSRLGLSWHVVRRRLDRISAKIEAIRWVSRRRAAGAGK